MGFRPGYQPRSPSAPWMTVLRKREAFREAFRDFVPEAVARFGKTDVARLLKNPGIIRFPAKIEATIAGARAYLAMAEAGEDFSSFVWNMVANKAVQIPGQFRRRLHFRRRCQRR
jgi:DNA-3-methyladenine glycosylase I